MLQYVLTALVGVVLGVVAMRVWQSRDDAAVPQSETTAPETVAGVDGPSPNNRKLLIGAGALVVVAAAALLLRPADKAAPATVLGAVSAGDPKLDDVDTSIQRLAKRLEKQPDDGEGFRLLGWSYVMTGKPQQAIEPYKRALQLLPGNAMVHAGYGEALVGVAGGKVTAEAKAEFEKALAIDKTEPRARYFAALWLAQNGNPQQALDQWIVLANSGPADAPWQGDVQRQIKETAAKLGVDVSGKLKVPAAAAPVGVASRGPTAAQIASGDAPKSVEDMVGGLASRLAANPRDPDGWVMLMRSRMVLKQEGQAGKDLAIARKALAGDAAALAKVNEAAKALGVPGA
jgi:cytochrome c-type biogenesis protein CcmH